MIRSLIAIVLIMLCVPPAPANQSWSITADSVLPGGEPANEEIAILIHELEKPEGAGAPVSLDEFRSLCDQTDSEVDSGALLKYAAPGSIRNQDFDHARYARILMRKDRVQAGVDFLRKEDRLLRAAQARYGVARQDIVSILMWESSLGEFVGTTRTFNALLAQLLYLEEAHETAGREAEVDDDDPAVRARRFEKLKRRAIANLAALIRLSKAKGQDPTMQLGSWAGAIGYPQFMPASLQYAVDGDGDGVIDLNHWPDAIFSVASYLEAHGYDMSYAGRKRGIRRYNPIDSYMHGVIRYADAIVAR